MDSAPSDTDAQLAARFRRYVPLPERIRRNRRRLRAFVAVYLPLGSLALALAAVFGATLVLLVLAFFSRDYDLSTFGPVLLWIWRNPLSLVAGVWLGFVGVLLLTSLVALFRGESRLLGRLGAIPAPTGQYAEAKSALRDVVLASGLPAPRLAIIPDAALNAFVIGRNQRRVWIGVTTGLLGQLSRGELRCVFAHLISRVRDGSARTSTVFAELLDGVSRAGAPLFGLLAPVYLIVGPCLLLASGVVLAGYRQQQMLNAESGDAEALLLTRDPEAVLRALQKVLPADNRPGTVHEPRFRDEVYGGLFFAWPAYSFADDPELARLERMRDALGPAGA